MVDRPIDDAVVRVEPGFAGFRTKLREGLARSMHNVQIRVPVSINTTGVAQQLKAWARSQDAKVIVRLEASRTGFRQSIRAAAREASNDASVKVNVTADARTLRESVRACAETMRPVKINLPIEVDCKGLHAKIRACVREMGEVQGPKIGAPRGGRRDGSILPNGRRDLGLINQITGAAGRLKLIDWGGAGVKPLRLLLGAAIALSPALIAMASSAAYASTSVVAMGAGIIGAAGAITAVTVAFGSVTGYLKQYTAVKKADAQQSAKAAAAETKQSNAVADSAWQVRMARKALSDALRQEEDAQGSLSDAYREAIRNLEDLRELKSDLARDERGAAGDVAAAQANLAEVNRNFWATDIDRAQAAQEVADAEDRLSDIQRDRKRNTEDLTRAERDGIEGSDQVTRARQEIADAHEAVIVARHGLIESQQQQVAAQDAVTEATQKATAADTELARQWADMSPAARTFATWLIDHENLFKGYRRAMESAVLPGFLTFLREATDRGKSGKGRSAFDVIADGAARLGRIVGETAGRIGKAMNTKWFKDTWGRINQENEKAFQNFGDAGVLMFKPILRLIAAAAPQLTRFSQWLEDLATKFSKWIDTFSDDQLKNYFKGAADELAKWWGIAEDIVVTIFNIFKTSLPTGQSLTQRLKDLTGSLRDWSGSAEGQAKIQAFFQFFKDIDYGKMFKVVAQAATMVGLFKVGKFALNHPIFTAFAWFAYQYPEATRTFIETVSSAMVGMLKFASDHPVAISALAALFLAYKGFQSFKAIKGKFSLPGITTATATMTVTAGTVIINGGLPGGLPGGAAAAGGAATFSSVATTAMRVLGGLTIATVIVDTILGPGATWDGFKALIGGPKEYGEWSRKMAPHFRRFFAMDLPNFLTAGGTDGWSSFQSAIENDFGPGFIRWWSHTLPDMINLGSGTGWDGLATDLGNWFGQTLPNSLNLGDDTGWSGLGSNFATWWGTTLPNMLVPGGQPGWTGLKNDIAYFFGHQIPDTLNLGDDSGWTGLGNNFGTWWGTTLPGLLAPGTQPGWTGLKNDIGHFFGHSLPDAINLGPGTGWSGLLTDFTNWGGSLIDGLWHGISDWATNLYTNLQGWWNGFNNWWKSIFGINSPSTVFAEFGRNLIQGLWEGFTGMWGGLVGTVGDWVKTNIIDTFTSIFSRGATGIREAFTHPFTTLTDALSGPVGAALGWLDRNLLEPLNGVLIGAGVAAIPLITKQLAASSAVGRAAGTAFTNIGTILAPGHAEGGMIAGTSPHNRADNIPAMLTAREYVQPVDSVDYYGTGMMDAIRDRRFPRLAAGGLVSSAQNLPGIGGPASFTGRTIAAFFDHLGGTTAQGIGTQLVAGMNAAIQAAFPPGTAVPGFGNWPATAASVHGHDSGVWRAIVKLVDDAGIPRGGYGGYNNRRTRRGGWSWHASGHAVDFSGFNQDELAEFFMARKPSVLELIHSSAKRNYGVRRGQDHDMGSGLYAEHRNHLHVAMASGGQVPVFDTGGILAPGINVVNNRTGGPEELRPPTTNRIHPQDIVLLAAHISRAVSGQSIRMNGRAVAETVNSYSYLPGTF